MRKQLHHFHHPAQLLFRKVHRCFLIPSSLFFHSHRHSSSGAASPSPSPPTRRQRLKGIKHHHQWWNHYFRHENLLVRSVHQKHFIVTQFVPNRQKHERGDCSKRSHQEPAGATKPQHLTALVDGSAKEGASSWTNNDGTQSTCNWEKTASQNKTNMPTTPTTPTTPTMPTMPTTPTTPTTHANTSTATAGSDTLAAIQTRDPNNPYDDLIMAFLTSKRQFGKRAVDRNRARRRVKEAARKTCLNQFDSSFWYVVVCKRQVQEATHEELCESFETIRDRFAKKDEQ